MFYLLINDGLFSWFIDIYLFLYYFKQHTILSLKSWSFKLRKLISSFHKWIGMFDSKSNYQNHMHHNKMNQFHLYSDYTIVPRRAVLWFESINYLYVHIRVIIFWKLRQLLSYKLRNGHFIQGNVRAINLPFSFFLFNTSFGIDMNM